MMVAGALLVALVLLYWLVQVSMLTRCMLVVPTLDIEVRPSREADELVTVIVPARDEEPELETAIRSRLLEEDSRLRFIFVNDRSTDATGSIMEQVASEDERAEVIHVEELPEGWLGKVHAMQVGVEASSSPWILLSDADVHFMPGTVRSAVDLAEERGVDHLAMIPSIMSPSLGLRFCLVPLLRTLSFMVRLWSVHDSASTAAMGVGAFNLVRRDTLIEAGGLESLKMEVIDDIGVGTIIKQHGGTSLVAAGRHGIRIAWYDRFEDFLQGIQRGTAHLPQGVPRVFLVLVCLFLFLLEVSPFLMLLAWPWLPALGWIGAVASTVVILLSFTLARYFGLPRMAALAVPAGVALGLYAAARCIMRGGRDGVIYWRGTRYRVSELQAGERVRFHADRFRSDHD
ncbi:MAG: hypothetical protein CMJ36_02495 [Phycisphaerae bacterium]|nr:hypothetical protein [Phycisphaerae bacterium]